MIGYYRNHQALSPELLTCIRFAAATHFDNIACISFNSSLLKRQGVTDQELDNLLNDPMQAPLEDKDKAMLSFVIKAIKGRVADDELERLQRLGFADSDILDAISHGFSIFAPGRMLRFLKMVE